MKRSLVVAAVALVGLVLGILVAGRPTSVPRDIVSSQIVVADSTTTTTTTTDVVVTTSTPSASTTTSVGTTTSLAPVGTVRVVVANATNVASLASRTVARLAPLGYVGVVATDATTDRPNTVVYYATGLEGEASRLATQLGLDHQRVQPRPDTAVTVTDDSADIWLLVGADWL